MFNSIHHKLKSVPVKPSKVIYYLVYFLVPAAFSSKSQNIIVNPSAELTPGTNGWTVVSAPNNPTCYTASGWGIKGNQNGFPVAQNGSYFFYPGCDGTSTAGNTYELRQDINVSANHSLIDAGGDIFTFSGYTQSYTQAPPDQAQIIVEYRNAANTAVLGSYNTGFTTNQGSWVKYTNVTTAPVGTRYIRIRLVAKEQTGPSVDAYFDNLSLTSNIPLPVTLLSFGATVNSGAVNLNWQTSSEINFSYFAVQRSADGTNWSEIAKIEGEGASGNSRYYSAADYDPINGAALYRLQMVDLNGTYSYSDIVTVKINGPGTGFFVAPTLVSSSLSVSLPDNGPAVAFVYNLSGQLVKKYELHNAVTAIDLGFLNKGLYVIKAFQQQKMYTAKFIKR
ncbi:MAG: T9SS type A sorting domain-containing protein [Bacteroidetes bacterium]|nr:T9SS type A sorting domain-containing protein [Bacteroidota bacterium]MBS1972760.1 T9SS type A sorting domain-containing protein [Bacteroidota bacterium]